MQISYGMVMVIISSTQDMLLRRDYLCCMCVQKLNDLQELLLYKKLPFLLFISGKEHYLLQVNDNELPLFLYIFLYILILPTFV